MWSADVSLEVLRFLEVNEVEKTQLVSKHFNSVIKSDKQKEFDLRFLGQRRRVFKLLFDYSLGYVHHGAVHRKYKIVSFYKF